MRADVESLKTKLADLWTQLPGLKLAMVFGSVARGQATEDSDLDVAVVGSGLDILAMTAALEQRLPTEVQVLQLVDPSVVLLAELVREAVPIYECVPGSFGNWLSKTLWQLEDDLPWYHRQQRAWLSRFAQKGM